MTKTESRKLLREVARLCEKAYRRGFQQGHHAGLERKATGAEVEDWRHGRESHGSPAGYDRSVPPPGTQGVPPAMQCALYRLWAELDGHDAVEALVDVSGLDVETGKAAA